jgi:hypothetical protein
MTTTAAANPTPAEQNLVSVLVLLLQDGRRLLNALAVLMPLLLLLLLLGLRRRCGSSADVQGRCASARVERVAEQLLLLLLLLLGRR